MCSMQLKLASFQLSIKTEISGSSVRVVLCSSHYVNAQNRFTIIHKNSTQQNDKKTTGTWVAQSICLFNQGSTIKSQLFAHRQQKCSFLPHFYFPAHDFL